MTARASRGIATDKQPASKAEAQSQAQAKVAVGPAASSSAVLQESAFAHLLKIESDARRSMSIRELDALFTAEPRKLMRARQVFVIDYESRGGRIVAMTGAATVDRSAPIVIWIEAMLRRMATETDLGKPVEFELPGYADADDGLTRDYPFRFGLCSRIGPRARA